MRLAIAGVLRATLTGSRGLAVASLAGVDRGTGSGDWLGACGWGV
jgi:hypothetical protein